MNNFQRLYKNLFGSNEAGPETSLASASSQDSNDTPDAAGPDATGAINGTANGTPPLKEKSALSAGWTREGRHPLLDQRSAFHNRFHDLAKARRNWQVVAILSLLAVLVLLIGFVRLAGQSRTQPYVIAMGRSGIPLPIGAATPLAEEDPRITRAVLVRVIRNLRTVLESQDAQRALLERAFLFCDAEAKRYISAWLSQPGRNPLELAGEIRRTVVFESLLQMPQAPHTWRVRWTEKTLAAGTWRTAEWEALVTVHHATPPSEKARLLNPTGLYITDLSWTKTHAAD